MRWPFIATGFIFAAALMAAAPASSGPKLEGLEQLWNAHMLAGTEGEYAGGKRSAYRSRKGYESAEGAVAGARATNRGISVSDLGGSRLLGLMKGAGWSLDGGLVARARLNGDYLELYGREVIRWGGGFLGLDTYAKPSDVSYDFFLLHRPSDAPQATILRKWSIPPEDISWSHSGLHEIVRGFLTYQPPAASAIVKITGLRQEREYTVDISGVAAGP